MVMRLVQRAINDERVVVYPFYECISLRRHHYSEEIQAQMQLYPLLWVAFAYTHNS